MTEQEHRLSANDRGGNEPERQLPRPPSMPFFPALEGLRGLAVAVVLLFHSGLTAVGGGFLGVSTFFTLSGFLITSLLLSEHDRSGGLDLARFWVRRFRRLMPAALATLTLAIVFGVLAADPAQRHQLGGDVVASLLYVANWRFVFSAQSYASLFSAPSPVLHFWSLAIEEQFYLFYPVVVYAVLKLLGWSRRAFAAALGGLLILSVGLTVFGGFSHDRIYFGTDTRMAELLVGALLATALVSRLQPLSVARDRSAVVLASVGCVAFVVTLAAWYATTQDSAWLYRGGLVGYAVASAAIVTACLLPIGPVTLVLGSWPFRMLGRISYGLYLYHWPIFQWITPASTRLDGIALFVVRVGLSLAIATLSYRYLELPIRQGRRPLGLRPLWLALAAAPAIAVAVIVVSLTGPPLVNDFAAAQQELANTTAGAATPRPGPSVGAPTPGGGQPPSQPGQVPRVAFFGDSTALVTSLGFGKATRASGAAVPLGGNAELGCGLGRGGDRRANGRVVKIEDKCNQWAVTWKQTIDQLRPDVAVVLVGPWDVEDRRLPGDSTWRAPGDPVYDDFLYKEMLAAVDVLSSDGAEVAWLTMPPVGANAKKAGQPEGALLDTPERVTRFNELVNRLPQDRPGKVSVIDLAGWVVSTGEDARLRPDGVHFGDTQAVEVANRFLVGAITEVYQNK